MTYPVITDVDPIDFTNELVEDNDTFEFPDKYNSMMSKIQNQMNQVSDAITYINLTGTELESAESANTASVGVMQLQLDSLIALGSANVTEISTAAGAINALLNGSAQVDHATSPALSMNRTDDTINAGNSLLIHKAFGGTTTNTNQGGAINFEADASWSLTTSHPTRMTIELCPVGSATPVEVIRVDPTGWTGFGATNPEARIHAQDTDATLYDSGAGLNLHNEDGGFIVDNTDDTADTFASMSLKSGTTNKSIARFALINSSGSAGITSDLVLMLRDTSTSVIEKFRWTDDGYFGIGIIPEVDLDIASASGTMRLRDTDGTDQYCDVIQSEGALRLLTRDNTSNGKLIIEGFDGTTSTEFARFNANGNFGVNDNNPASKITTAGDIESTGAGNGLILEDTVTTTRYRVVVTSGAITLAAV